jgi:hypothetical protein
VPTETSPEPTTSEPIVASAEPAAPVEPAPKVVASTDAQPKSELSAADQAKLRQLMLDLRWLITEGYVTEYGDGRLYTPPPMPPVKKAESKPAAKPAAKSVTPPSDTTESEVPAEAEASPSLSEDSDSGEPEQSAD